MKDSLKGWAGAVMEAIVIVIVLFFVCFPVQVDGLSMEGTLNDGDRVFVSRAMAEANMYTRGDIIVFNHKIGDKKIKMVKRVIAVEGDTIEIKDGDVWLNNEVLTESYIDGKTKGDVLLTVGEGRIFVLGDNRESSVDSRKYGDIDRNEVSGRVIMKFYPPKDITVY